MILIGTRTGNRARAASDEYAVGAADAGVGIEDQRCLRLRILDRHLSQQGSVDRLQFRPRARSEHARWCDGTHHGRHEVEPVDGEVVEDQVGRGLECGALDPAVVPVDVAVDAVDVADQAAANRLAHVAEVGRPAGVLVHRQRDALLVGQIGQPLAIVEVEHERLLAQHVLAGLRAASISGGRTAGCVAMSTTSTSSRREHLCG